MEKTLQGLEADEVIKIINDPLSDPASDSSSSVTTIELTNLERARGRENFDFYCFLIWPFVEASWLGAVSLMGLTPPTNTEGDVWLDLTRFQDKAQLVGPPHTTSNTTTLTNRVSWAKPSTTKATLATLKLSTRKP